MIVDWSGARHGYVTAAGAYTSSYPLSGAVIFVAPGVIVLLDLGARAAAGDIGALAQLAAFGSALTMTISGAAGALAGDGGAAETGGSGSTAGLGDRGATASARNQAP